MLNVGDLVTLQDKMVKLFGFQDVEVVGVVISILNPIPNHLINQAYIVQWMSEEYAPDHLPLGVLHGFSDIEQDIIFYEHELLLLEDYNRRENKKINV
tara:strand:- start:163 stop:456 length:294 start_codon:yes stop_codon:yes gene_type:complete